MELRQVAIKVEKRGAVDVKEEDQPSGINRDKSLKNSTVLQCRQCGAGFRNRRDQQRHLRLSHPEEYQEQVLARSCLQCHLCDLPCSSSRQLIEHQRSQHPLGRPFQCPVCGDSFIQSHALLNHQRRHVCQSRYTCRDCPHTCHSLTQLLAHRHAHSLARNPPPAPLAATAAEEPQQPSVSSLQCPQCFITFRDLQTSQQHMRLQHPALYEQRLQGRTVFACRHCDRTFRSSPQLSAHQRAHSQSREDTREDGEGREVERPDAQGPSPSHPPLPDQHKCPHCNFLFRDAKTKMRHMNVKHPPGCPLPPPLLFTADEKKEEEVVMAVQVKEEDEEQVKHEEDDSSLAPRHPGNLNPSLLNEGRDREGVVKVQFKLDTGDEAKEEMTNEGVCECALCGKGFKQLLAVAGQRRRGRRRDHPAPPGPQGHACRHCSRLCHSREALRQHQRLHTLERPYRCQDCGNTFKRASGLQRHKSVHT